MGTSVLDQLHEALDALAGLDADTLDDATVDDLVVGLAVGTTRLEAVWCQLIGVWDNRTLWADNGSKAPGARLARDTHVRRGRADRLVTRGRTLDSMPATAEAYAAGEINGDHVDLIASCDRQWRHAIFADHEATLVNICRTPYFHVAAQAVAYWKHRADLDAADDHGDTIKHRRHLSVSPGWDGEIVVNGALDPVGGAIYKTELDRLCEQLRLSDLRDGVERTIQQRRADAQVEMAIRSATAPADGLRPKPLFTVTIGIDPFNHLCETAAGTVLAPGLLMPLLSDAEFERIVYDPANRNIQASRRRSFTGAIRRIIEVRDRHCQLADDCFEPAAHCDVDHITPYSKLPITCICTGQIGCTTHNRIIKTAGQLPSSKKQRTGDPLPCEHCAHLWATTDTNNTGSADSRAPPTAV